VAAGQLVRLEDGYHLLDAVERQEKLGVEWAVVANHAHQHPLGAARNVRPVPKLLYPLHHCPDLVGVGSHTHDYDHWFTPFLVVGCRLSVVSFVQRQDAKFSMVLRFTLYVLRFADRQLSSFVLRPSSALAPTVRNDSVPFK